MEGKMSTRGIGTQVASLLVTLAVVAALVCFGISQGATAPTALNPGRMPWYTAALTEPECDTEAQSGNQPVPSRFFEPEL